MRRPEQAIQREVFRHFRQRAAPGVVVFAVPNGGFRRKTEAAIMKGLGTVAGAPDIVACRDGKFFALEVKAPGGRVTKAQQKMLLNLRAAGASACHAHGLDQCLHVLEGWGLLRGVANTRGLRNEPLEH